MSSGHPSHSSLPLSSPFALLPNDIAALCASKGFQIIRNYLANELEYPFCSVHGASDAGILETFRLHRDILHALLMPIDRLFDHTSALAQAALCTCKFDDLELAYRGEARGAFLWLQCFLEDEEAFCHTRGCPGCVISSALSTESSIRLALAAIMLSQADRQSTCDGGHGYTHPTENALPDFSFFEQSMRIAVDEDPFWGPSYWPYLSLKALQLHSGIQDLVKQCSDLKVLVTSPRTTPLMSPVTAKQAVPLHQISGDGTSDLKIQESQLAKRQLRLHKEEHEML